MKTILHYSLGFNSDRGGGLTKYSTDLMVEQAKSHNVFLLYPGEIRIFHKRQSIKKEKKRMGIVNFSVTNPLPIPFLCGVNSKRYLEEKSDLKMWKQFFVSLKPDVFHVHTLIGLHKECIEAAKYLNIPIIYTTHDYFGICPKQTLVFEGKICQDMYSCKNCSSCNASSISPVKLYLLHSRLFIKVRHLSIVKRIKNMHKEKVDKDLFSPSPVQLDFKKMQNQYIDIFSKIDFFNYN
ncbi:MAG: glycosyltransferase, partial [Lachnospiraceae bacterium]|nr:glycosyltransferase [Lachnospiraceae bacterium]